MSGLVNPSDAKKMNLKYQVFESKNIFWGFELKQIQVLPKKEKKSELFIRYKKLYLQKRLVNKVPLLLSGCQSPLSPPPFNNRLIKIQNHILHATNSKKEEKES